MYLNKLTVKTKCDNGACRNYADYEIVREDTMVAMRLRLCESCLKEISALAIPLLNVSQPKKSSNDTKKQTKTNKKTN